MVEFKQLIVLLKQLMAELGQMTVELPFGRYMMNNDETVGFLGKIINSSLRQITGNVLEITVEFRLMMVELR